MRQFYGAWARKAVTGVVSVLAVVTLFLSFALGMTALARPVWEGTASVLSWTIPLGVYAVVAIFVAPCLAYLDLAKELATQKSEAERLGVNSPDVKCVVQGSVSASLANLGKWELMVAFELRVANSGTVATTIQEVYLTLKDGATEVVRLQEQARVSTDVPYRMTETRIEGLDSWSIWARFGDYSVDADRLVSAWKRLSGELVVRALGQDDIVVSVAIPDEPRIHGIEDIQE